MELEEAHFSLLIGNANQDIHLNTTSFGKNYPYRDSCSTKNDPLCISGKTCYWKSSTTGRFEDKLKFEIRNSNGIIFSDLVPIIHQQELHQNELRCDKTNLYGLLFHC